MSQPAHLEIIPLGGLGEFGMNMMLYRWGAEAILVDTGMMFPRSEHLGVDVVIPDLSFLDDCGTIHGTVLTHGHEDHIGALPFVLARHDVPVFASPYTQGLVRHRLREHDLHRRTALRPLPDVGAELELGPFRIEIVPVTHSIPQAAMVVIHSPVGTLVHTADFKLDPTPPEGTGTDLRRLSALGERGVLALLSDSTNAERPGITPGERTVVPALDALIAQASGRVMVTTFASNVARLKQVFDLGERHGRKVAVVGSSMQSHVEVAQSLGLFQVPPGRRVEPETAMDLPAAETLFLVTGSQGEPMSALARIAVDKHRHVFIQDGDVVIHSARVIPGNRKSVDRLVDHILRRGARVVTADDAAVHVSGHPAADELRLVLQLLRPRFLIPIHGEYRQLLAHARIGRDLGMDADHVVLADSGDVIALAASSCDVVDRIPVGRVFIDATLEEVDVEVLRDRRRLAGDGIVVAVVAVDRASGTVGRPPEIATRGFVTEDDEERLLEDAARIVRRTLAEATPEERTDEAVLKIKIQTDLRRFFRKRIQRRPMVIPVIVEF